MKKKGTTKTRVIIIAVVLLIIIFSALVNFITNLIWFYEVQYQSVFLKRIFTQIAIGVPAFVVFGAIAFYFFKTFKKSYNKRVTPPPSDRSAVTALNRVAIALSLVVAALATLFTVSTTWFEVLKFINGASFGLSDPIFNLDISFYVFKMGLIKQIITLIIGLVVGFAVASLIYLMALNRWNPQPSVGDEPVQEEEESFSNNPGCMGGAGLNDLVAGIQKVVTGGGGGSQSSGASSKDGSVKRAFYAAPTHAIVLGVVFCLAFAANVFMWQFDLLYSSTGAVHGAGYTDVNVKLWMYRILIVLSVLAAAGVIVAAKKKSLRTLLATPALMIAIGILGAIVGSVVQSLIVTADEINLERQYLAHTIAFTQYAYSLDNVTVRDFPVHNNLTRADIENNYQTISNIRINDNEPVRLFYNNVQTIRPYYVFTDVYVDRYMINGEYTQVYLAAREIDDTARSPIPQSFLNRHVKYTHGYGLTLSRVDSISPSGLPEMLIRNIPPVSDVPEIDIARPYGRPEIYFGRMTNDYILVNTNEPAFDFPIGGDEGRNAEVTHYEGTAGIRMNFINRLLFAIREGNIRIFISGALTDESKIVINRSVIQRVSLIMPQLSYDSEPYMITVDGRLFWIVEAYTTTSSIPYSEPYNNSANYIRNSVKIVVDAFNGSMYFYVADPTDPIVATYRNIFPTLFKDLEQMDEISPELRNHIRYPNMLLNVQAHMYRRYHMNNVTMFYQNEDLWDISTEISGNVETRMVPNYYIMKLPGEEKAEFVNTIPFTPRERRNMSALLVVRNDTPNYGELVLYQLPKGRQIPGPMQVDAQIEQHGQISQDIALWSQSGSIVSRGNMFVVPIEASFLYIKPIYLEAETGSIPEVRRVVVAYGEPVGDGVKIAYKPTLDAALEELFGLPAEGAPPTVTPEPGETDRPPAQPPAPGTQTVAEIIGLASEAFDNAQRAQRNGDWSAYGQYLSQLEQYLNQLQSMTR